jgi:copper(I)-binding protein
MKPPFLAQFAAIVLSLASAFSPGVLAQDTKIQAGSLLIETPWVRATPPGAKVGAGYLRVTNTGSEADRLVGGASGMSQGFEVHEMTVNDHIMRMRPLPAGLEIKPGETVELKPGSYHFMFVGLKDSFLPGQKVKATLSFEKAGKVDVAFDVRSIGAPIGPMDHNH